MFARNLTLNRVTNVEPHGEALSGDGRPIELRSNPRNSGAPSAHSATLSHRRVSGIASLTLDALFERHTVDHCRLLKMDCEGSEYAVLQAANVWGRIDYLCGEFHSNQRLRSQGFSPEGLRDFCVARLSPEPPGVFLPDDVNVDGELNGKFMPGYPRECEYYFVA